MTLAAPRQDPVQIFRSALRFRPSGSLDGTNHRRGHCLQTAFRQVDVPDQKGIQRQPVAQERHDTRHRLINQNVPGHLTPNVQKHLRRRIHGRPFPRKYPGLPGKYHGLPVLYHRSWRDVHLSFEKTEPS